MDSFDNIEDIDVINIIILDDETRLTVSKNMIEHGGNFVRALGECLFAANTENRGKLAETFINYVKEYAPDKWDKR
jgi:hypothetical protein